MYMSNVIVLDLLQNVLSYGVKHAKERRRCDHKA